MAAGFYNTLLESDQTALVVECLNGYRLKEKKPNNMGEFKTPIGVVEIVKAGRDLTLVSYGSTLRLAEQAARELLEVDIDVEVIDVQSLIPFDRNQDNLKSIQKTRGPTRILTVPLNCSLHKHTDLLMALTVITLVSLLKTIFLKKYMVFYMSLILRTTPS